MGKRMKKATKSGFANVVLLGLVSLLNDLSSEMIFPILPMFIMALGGGGLAIGLIGGVMEALSHLLKVGSGFWSDRIRKRKPFIFIGYFSSAFFKLLMSLAKTWPFILLTASFERLGKGVREAPRDALISQSMPKRRGAGFGIQRAFDTTGAILGSIVVLLLFWYFALGFNQIILVAAIIGFVALIPIYFIKDIIPKKIKKKKFTLKNGFSKQLKLFIFISTVFAFANFSYMFFILKARELFPIAGRLAIAIPILLYIFFNVFYASFAIPFGNLGDKIGKKRVLIAGYFLFALTCLGFVLFENVWVYAGLFIAYGLVFAMTYGNQRAYVADLSTDEQRASALGVFQTITGLIILPASLVAGWLWTINTDFTFAFGAIVSFVSVILFLIFSSYLKK